MPKSYSLKASTAIHQVRGVSFARSRSVSGRYHPYCGVCRHEFSPQTSVVDLRQQSKIVDSLTMPMVGQVTMFTERSLRASLRREQCKRHDRLLSDSWHPSNIESPEKPSLKPFFSKKSSTLDTSELSSLQRNYGFVGKEGLEPNAGVLRASFSRKSLKEGLSARPTLKPFYYSNGKFYKLLKNLTLPFNKK